MPKTATSVISEVCHGVNSRLAGFMDIIMPAIEPRAPTSATSFESSFLVGPCTTRPPLSGWLAVVAQGLAALEPQAIAPCSSVSYGLLLHGADHRLAVCVGRNPTGRRAVYETVSDVGHPCQAPGIRRRRQLRSGFEGSGLTCKSRCQLHGAWLSILEKDRGRWRADTLVDSWCGGKCSATRADELA